MEEQVYRIWTILSAFEESSAACISEMLRHVSSGHYMEGVRMAEKFVLHVETLFAAIDDLNSAFRSAASKGNFTLFLSHSREGEGEQTLTRFLLLPFAQKCRMFGKLECFARKSSTSSCSSLTLTKLELEKCRSLKNSSLSSPVSLTT